MSDTIAGPTPAYVAHFVAQRGPHAITFGWRMAMRRGVLGFDLYADAHRLNAHTIAVHNGPIYHYTARASETEIDSRGFTLRVLLAGGQHITVWTR